jgi:hypothetical protein
MSEERPVPRRESPWGLPEGDKRQPKAHRCNDRAEDVVQVLSLSSHVLFPVVCLGIASGWRCIVQ